MRPLGTAARCLLLLAATVAPALAGSLPPALAGVLKDNDVPARDVSLYVQEVGATGPALAHREDEPRNPASVIKLLTTLAALDVLGPAYTWRTEAHATGPIVDGVLQGDLVLKGYGDPYLTPEAFWHFVYALRARGLRAIGGDVVVDNSFFDVDPLDRGAFDGRPFRAYNALPAALSLNFQATRLYIVPDAGAGKVRVFSDPPLANLAIDNDMRLDRGPCRKVHRSPLVHVQEEDAGATVKVRGRYATDCPEASMDHLMLAPAEHVGGAFAAMWSTFGGTLAGGVRSGTLPEGAHLLHDLESRPLADAIRGMNKFSNNLMTRHLLLTLGARVHGAPATLEKGREALAGWLRERGLLLPELVVDNGAGLSREARSSAAGLARLLLFGWGQAYMPELVSSLAVVGVDGTMRRRLQNTPLAGRAHLKTGSLDDVSGLAGYVLDRAGRRWAVVLLVNHRGLTYWQGRTIQDALLEWVYEGPTPLRAAGGESGSVPFAATGAAEAAAGG